MTNIISVSVEIRSRKYNERSYSSKQLCIFAYFGSRERFGLIINEFSHFIVNSKQAP